MGLPSEAKAEATVFKNPQELDDGYLRFFGEATTSSSYGGYGGNENNFDKYKYYYDCLLYTSPSPRDMRRSRMPSSA